MNRYALICIAATMVAAVSGATVRSAELDAQYFTLVEADKLEYRAQSGEDLLVWEGMVRHFNDDQSFVLLTEGEYLPDESEFESVELQALYQRPVSDFWDARFGLRQDLRPEPLRTFAVFGVSGLAEQFIEVDASAFLSHRGDVALRFEAELDLRLTQRVVLQPILELDVALTDDRATGVGAGLDSMETGLRLRYELTRKFAPYLGVNYERKFMRSADFARDEGENTEALALVLGLHFFF